MIEPDADLIRRSTDVIDRIGFDRLVEHGLDPIPRGNRTRELRQRVADEPQREDEQCEQEDHTRELADGEVTGADPQRAEEHEQDVRERRDHVEDRLEPTAHPDGVHPRRSDLIGEAGQALGLAFLGAVRLDELDALEALVDARRELAELVLGPSEVTGDPPFVDHVRGDEQREHDDRDDAEDRIDHEHRNRRDHQHDHRPDGERDRAEHAHRRLRVDAGASHEIAVGATVVPAHGLLDVALDHLVGEHLGDPPLGDRGKAAPHDDGDGAHHTDAEHERDARGDRRRGHLAVFESRQDDLVDDPADRETRRDREHGEHGSTGHGDGEQLRLHAHHGPDETNVAPGASGRPQALVPEPAVPEVGSPWSSPFRTSAGWSVTRRFYQQAPAISSKVVTADPITQTMPGAETPSRWRRSPIRKALIIIGVAAFVAFWTWALFFASKTAVNKIEDRAWAERAEAICVDYDLQLQALEAKASPDLQVRADLVVESTDLLSAMLDEVMAVTPTDDKGQAIVPAWEADYRTLLQDRYRYAERLRAGENVAFTETAVKGVPITERIETFAADNEMASCGPPRGSVV